MDSKLKLPDITQDAGSEDEAMTEAAQSRQAQIKQGWSLLAALHCILLPERVNSPNFKHPLVEMLVRRWQDRCLEVCDFFILMFIASDPSHFVLLKNSLTFYDD